MEWLSYLSGRRKPVVEDKAFDWSVKIPEDIGMFVDVFGPNYI